MMEQEHSSMTQQQQDDLRAVVSTPAGRRFLYWMIYAVADVKGLTFPWRVHDGRCAELVQAWKDGRRSVGANLEDEMRRFAPGEWIAMEEERLSELRRELLDVAPKEKRT